MGTNKAQILVIDDNPDNLHLLSVILKHAGYEVLEAETGQDGFCMAKTQKPDLVLADVVLPDISGLEVCKSIKADPALARSLVILLSGIETDPDYQAKSLESGADSYIVRPISNRELLARIQAMLRFKQAEAERDAAQAALQQTLDQLEMKVEARTKELALANQALQAEVAERRRVEQDLKASEEKYRLLVDNSLQGLIILNKEGKIVFANQALARMSGYTVEELLALPPEKVKQLVHPDDRSWVWDHYRNRLAGQGAPEHYEYRGLREDGSTYWVEIDASLIEYRGQPAVQAAIVDITERKQAEKSLRESEQKFRNIIEQSYDGIALADEQGLIIEWNWGQEQLSGLKRAEVIGRSAWDVQFEMATPEARTPEAYERIKASMQEFLATGRIAWLGQLMTLEIQHSDGSFRTVQQVAFPIPTEQGYMMGSIARDITEQVRIEEALRQSEEKYRNIFFHSEIGIFQSTLEGRFFNVNPALARMLGYGSPQEVIDTIEDIAAQVYADPSVRDEIVEKLREAEGVVTFENQYLHKDGQEWTAFLHIRVVRDQEGRPLFLEGFVEDITERKQMEEALRESEARLRQVIDLVPHLIFAKDRDGRFILVNQAGANFAGLTVEEMTGRLESEWVSDQAVLQEIQAIDRAVIDSGNPEFIPEDRFVDHQGRAHIFQTTKIPFDYNGERQQGVLGVSVDMTALKQAEEALRESEERYRALVDASPSSIMVVQEGRYVFANPAGAGMLGFSDPAELVGVSVMENLSPDHHYLIAERLKRLDQDQSNLPVEMKLLRKDGTILYVQSTSVPIIFRDSPAALVIGLDVTERKQMEERLQASEARYRALFEQANDAIFLEDLDDQIIDVNSRACELLGYSREELLSMKVPQLQAPESRGPVGGVVRQELEQYGEEPFEAMNMHRDGSRIPVEVSTAQIVGEGGRRLALCIVRDITERKQAEEALRASEALFRRLFEHAPIGMALTTLDGRYLRVNQSLCDTLGYTAAELLDRTFVEVSHPDDLAPNQAWREQALREERPHFQMEKRFITKKGEIVYTILQVTLIRSGLNRPLYFIGQVVDITGRKRIERTLQQRNKELALLNRVSQMLLSTLDLDQRLKDFLEEVRQLLGVVACSVWLVDPEMDELVCRQATGPRSDIVEGWRLALGQGVVGWVAQRGQSLIVPDTQSDPRYYNAVDQQTGLALRSVLAVPLWVKETAIGVVQAVSEAVGRFTNTDLLLLEPLAAIAAIAIDNARLYEQVREDAETKTMLLREVNHRVGNNLTAITGMLALERRHLKEADQAAYDGIMADLTNRIMGLATVHNMLSDFEWLPLPLDELTRQVIYSSLQMLSLDKRVTVDVAPSPILIHPDQAHHLALAINELATNTIKYALLDRDTVRITVTITTEEDTIRFQFEDSGPGYPEEVLRLERHSVGLDLIQKIARRLRGTWSLHNDSGAVTILQFPTDPGLAKKA